MIKEIALYFFSFRLIITFSALFIATQFPLNIAPWLGTQFQPFAPYYYWIWANFDGVPYLHIARNGYSYPNFAYFPMFSFLINMVYNITSFSYFLSGLIVSNVNFILSVFFLYKIVLLDYPRRLAKRTVILMLCYPLAFFYGAIYTDSTYLIFSLLSFYFARQSKWLPAGIFGFFAGMTRIVGSVLLVALLLEWFIQNKPKKLNFKVLISKFIKQKAYYIFLIPLAIVAYSTYLHINYGDFLLFQRSMDNWSQENWVFPLQVIYRYFKILLFSAHNFIYYVSIFELIATFFYFFLSAYVFFKVRMSYGLLMFLTFIIPTFTGTLQGMPRYILHLFPGFIALALLTEKFNKLFWFICLTLLALQIIALTLYTRGYFIA